VYDGLDEQEGAWAENLERPLEVIIWGALTDASVEADCMEVIPGSHRLG